MSGIDNKNISIEDFPKKTFDKIRYRDIGLLGHVNNAIFSTFFETGRAELFNDTSNPLTDEKCSFVIANMNKNFISEMHWPGIADIGTGIKKIGNSSVVLFQAIYQDGVLSATAESVLVQISEVTRKPVSITDETRKYLKQYMI